MLSTSAEQEWLTVTHPSGMAVTTGNVGPLNKDQSWGGLARMDSLVHRSPLGKRLSHLTFARKPYSTCPQTVTLARG
jgi:hypothetical protein